MFSPSSFRDGRKRGFWESILTARSFSSCQMIPNMLWRRYSVFTGWPVTLIAVSLQINRNKRDKVNVAGAWWIGNLGSYKHKLTCELTVELHGATLSGIHLKAAWWRLVALHQNKGKFCDVQWITYKHLWIRMFQQPTENMVRNVNCKPGLYETRTALFIQIRAATITYKLLNKLVTILTIHESVWVIFWRRNFQIDLIFSFFPAMWQ